MKKNYYKRISYITEDVLNTVITESGYDLKTLKGGNFFKAKQMALDLTENHTFKNKTTKYRCIQYINRCKDITRLYTALFNMRNAMTHPEERINKKRYV